MNVRGYLLVLAVGSAAAFASWFLVLLMIDPVESGGMGKLAFALTLFLALIGVFTLLGTLVRLARFGEDIVELAVSRSLRQALLLSGLVLGVLFFSSKDTLSLPSLILLLGIVGVFEFFFLSKSLKGEARG